jgi:hypothetical protein
MNNKLFQQMLGLILAVLLLAGCSGAPAQPAATPTPVPLIAKPGKWSGPDMSFEVTADGKIPLVNLTEHSISGGVVSAQYFVCTDISVKPDGTFESKSDCPGVTIKFNSPTTASANTGTATETVEWKSP